MRHLTLAALAACLAFATVAAELRAPDVLVRETADEVLSLLRSDPATADDVNRLVELVEERVVSHFDFERMTKLAVGKHWRSATDEQRRQLVDEFHTLLVRTYSVALIQFRDYVIDYRPLEPGPDPRLAVVKTLITRDGGKPLHMDYRMVQTEAGWKVYDVLVDGVSLVVNYRSLFNSKVTSAGIDGLIELLREKNAEAKAS